jgi:Glycosyltransferase family 87
LLPPLHSRAEALDRFRWPAVLCALLLFWGWARTVPGAQYTAPWGYRGWSFTNLAYSDVLALHADRGARAHALPYLHDKIEYPVLLGVAMWAPSLVAPSMKGYFTLTYLLGACSALGILWILARHKATSLWALALSPVLVVYAPLNWDLLGALPLFLGLHAWAQERRTRAALWLSAAACTKVFPLLALGLLLVCARRSSLRHALWLGLLALLFAAAVNLPFALASQESRDNWSWFFVYSRIREIEPSVYSLLRMGGREFVGRVNAFSSLFVLAVAAAFSLYELRTRRLEIPPALVLLFCAFFLVNKVYSPQYWIWVVLVLAWAGAPGWLSAIASATALADYLSSFTHLHLQMERSNQLFWFEQQLFWPMVTARYLVLLGCAVWALRRLTVATDPPLDAPAAPV